MAKTTAVKATEPDFATLREKLLEKRQDILDLYRSDLAAGQASADEGTEDIVDRANNSYNREFMFSLSDTERQLLFQVDEALGRMEVGTYGECAHCNRKIGERRLEAVPWARYCIDCQELKEKGLLED